MLHVIIRCQSVNCNINAHLCIAVLGVQSVVTSYAQVAKSYESVFLASKTAIKIPVSLLCVFELVFTRLVFYVKILLLST